LVSPPLFSLKEEKFQKLPEKTEIPVRRQRTSSKTEADTKSKPENKEDIENKSDLNQKTPQIMKSRKSRVDLDHSSEKQKMNKL